jgi:hypothetical protein
MNFYYEGIRRFVICSSDSDYSPLVLFLREHDCFVIIVGKAATPNQLQEACSLFLGTDQPPFAFPSEKKLALSPVEVTLIPTNSTTTLAEEDPRQQHRAHLITLLHNAATALEQKQTPEWILNTKLFVQMKTIDARFTPRLYGYSSMPKLLADFSELFHLRKDPKGHLYIKRIVESSTLADLHRACP